MMRIITGSAKGKKLDTLEGDATRPTSERIKEAIFSSLQFDIESRAVLDLFAGSGQMGLEALSRGAASAMFIDSAAEAIAVCKENAKRTELFDRCRFLVSDYRNFIRKASGERKFDLVFIDPPYAMACCTEALKRLAEADLLLKGALVVLESGEEEIDAQALIGFEVQKKTNYGKKTALHILLYRGEE
jgi:16S rRNA (guanine(966)-N(2))-methyltransferase RsmD